MVQKELFINAVNLIDVDGRKNIPTVLLYKSDKEILIGALAIEDSEERHQLLNEDFKVDLGNCKPGSSSETKRRFLTASGKQQSADVLTSHFINKLLRNVDGWFSNNGYGKAEGILLAEPLSMQEDVTSDVWLQNYREWLRRILHGKFEKIDFLPEPFAVFQYYRYGVRHPILAGQGKQCALVIDFGGGTFDTCIVETTIQGDISMSLKHSRPLAAASQPVGGFFFNRIITEELFRKLLGKDLSSKFKKSLDAYKSWRKGQIDNLDILGADVRNFINHFHSTAHKIEEPKIALCKSIISWNLDAKLDVTFPISLPENPFVAEPRYVNFNLSGMELREIFVKKIWEQHLKNILGNALRRGQEELEGQKISVVLLSGGSANIRWLVPLLKRDFSSVLGNAQILELQDDYQQVVAKGLAVECARRYYNKESGSEFCSVTYNRLCLLLNSDEYGCEAQIYKPQFVGLPSSDIRGVLLPSASILRDYIDKDISWKVRLDRPPHRKLDYYFLRSSFNHEDSENVHNLIDHTVYSPSNCRFDSSIQIEMRIKQDGTCMPKFIYKSGEIAVSGKPFVLDMTYGQNWEPAKAYIGFDFGTSNTSVSYVNEEAIQVFQTRANDKIWKGLNTAVHELPFPISLPLANYLGEVDSDKLVRRSLEFIESALTIAAYCSYMEFCTKKKGAKTKIFKGFTQRSAGPLWNFLKECLNHYRNDSIISSSFMDLLRGDQMNRIDDTITRLAEFKHEKRAGNTIDHIGTVQFLTMACHKAFSENIFGFFELVQKEKFEKAYSGNFRHAIGNQPFYIISKYKGLQTFSKEEPFIFNKKNKIAISLQPLMFWDFCESHPDIEHCFFYDKKLKEGGFSFKASGYPCTCEVTTTNKYAIIAEQLEAMMIEDILIEPYEGIELNVE
ncbi:MAG: hypothetical protein STSR0002_07360 [Smithella sp.]|jgi:hypothetical protein